MVAKNVGSESPESVVDPLAILWKEGTAGLLSYSPHVYDMLQSLITGITFQRRHGATGLSWIHYDYSTTYSSLLAPPSSDPSSASNVDVEREYRRTKEGKKSVKVD